MAATDFITEAQADTIATDLATAIKAVKTLLNGNVADLSALTTTQKGTLVAAVNDLQSQVTAAAQSGGAAIDDVGTSTSTVWSSTKTNSEITSAASGAVTDAATYTDAEIATIVTSLQAYADTAEADALSAANSYTDAEIAALVASSPAALDTLAEFATALGNDANFATTITTALGNRLKVDGTAQTISAGNQTIALANLGVVRSTVDFGTQIATDLS